MSKIASRMLRASFILIAMVSLAPIVMGQQAYPNKPVRIIVPYPPGGTADIVGRTIAEKLGVIWGQSVIVENRAGAGGTIGVDSAVKAASDGYTLVLGVTGPLTIAPGINAQLAYDPLRDLVPITLVAAVPSLIAVHPSVCPCTRSKGVDRSCEIPARQADLCISRHWNIGAHCR